MIKPPATRLVDLHQVPACFKNDILCCPGFWFVIILSRAFNNKYADLQVRLVETVRFLTRCS